MKRKISLIIALMLILSSLTSVSATEESAVNKDTKEVTEEPTEVEPLKLSLEDAVRIATENSREMWKIDDGIAKVKEARRDARDAKKAAEDIMAMSFEEIAAMEEMYDMKIDVTNNYVEKLLAKNGYYITYADTQQIQLEKNREMLLAGIEIEAKSLYYNVLLAEQTIVITKLI
jgi:hypothetical protein